MTIQQSKISLMRAQLLNQIKDPDTTIRFFMIRDSSQKNTNYEFDQPILQKISDSWNAQGLKFSRILIML